MISFFGLTALCFFRFFSASAAISIFSFSVCSSTFEPFTGCWLNPIRLLNESVAFMLDLVAEISLVATLSCVVVERSLENILIFSVLGCNVFSVFDNDDDDDDINCMSSRRLFSPFTSRVILRKNFPTAFIAPSVSVIRLNADCDNSLLCS